MMNSDKYFRYTLIISLTIHGALLFRPPNLNFLRPFKPTNKIEVTYLKLKPQQTIETKKEPPKREINLKSGQNQYAKQLPAPPFIEKEQVLKGKLNPLKKRPRISHPDVISVKKIIRLKPLESNRITNPIYLTYYQIVREKIRRYAYQSYTRSDTGQVYLTFVILADGKLSGLQLMEEKSNASSYLKETALKSIRHAAPYPAFPKELDYPRLSFNVIISFEVE